ncbi:hypothetical protein Tco_0432771 [Tanacetum coccineum]
MARRVDEKDSLGRNMKKLKENVHAIQVGCENYRGAHLNKECPPGYYTRTYNQPPSRQRKLSLTEIITKYMEESVKRKLSMTHGKGSSKRARR